MFTVCLQIVTVMSTIDDLNYPEKTETYYIVNAPYIFSACWKVGNRIRLVDHSILMYFFQTVEMLLMMCSIVVTLFAGSKTPSAGKNQEESSGAAW